MSEKPKKRSPRFFKLLNWYPPYIGAGVRVKSVNDQATRFEVEMKLRWWNRNMYGTHFGGSLYAMCDPFFVFIIGHFLGKGYIVWDSAASIRFRKPGRGTVRAIFEITPSQLAEIQETVDALGKQTFDFTATVLGPEGEVVAELDKTVYVRKKT